MIAFDLDPGPPATVVECAEVACRLRDAFDHFGLVAFPKTSGSKGMQLYVPLNTPATYDADQDVRAWAIAQVLERRHPGADRVGDDEGQARGQGVHRLEPERRAQDDGLRLLAARARRADGLDAGDLGRGRGRGRARGDPDDSTFTSAEVLARVAEHGDPFAPVLELEQELPG